MPSKRKHRASPSSKGLAAGEQLKRNTLVGGGSSPWGWVGTEVTAASNITQGHLLATCGFSKGSTRPFCPNKFAQVVHGTKETEAETKEDFANGELVDDVIVISDDEGVPCSKKLCQSNPNCLNYLGQKKWEDEDYAREVFMKAANLGDNPILDARDPDLPVGLKNLGATCYANASLQVWFRDLAFRSGVYHCQPSQETQEKFKESPIFQLQVTFAALQESTQSVYNPAKLVESLQLRTTEQQDAQEFSKLFISHLDAEFRKQSISSLRSLITDQFQGKQVYGTICDNCRYRSERVFDFLEVEINFENDSKLEDRIAALLQPERLSDDNKYLCSQCSSLQDATRYTELRELPPVLHFSLLRFVYDVTSMERKKSIHAISFPKNLDMNRFLGTAAARKMAASDKCGDNIYELRGVLLHKGTSAYHGHYEAQVFDAVNESWFQFNDEIVTKIKTLADKRIIDVDITEEKPCGSQGRKNRANARKRRRVEDSDDEIDRSQKLSDPDSASNISSKDAYMLIYARKEQCGRTYGGPDSPLQVMNGDRPADILDVPSPPAHALEVVKELNAAHDEACRVFSEKERKSKIYFDETRRKVMDIYRSWNISSGDESSIVVSQQALEAWLSTHCIESALEVARRDGTDPPGNSPLSSRSSAVTDTPSHRCVTTEEILCTHQRCDPKKAGNMKRISQEAYEKVLRDTSCSFHPTLTPKDVCTICVGTIFKERLYQIEHPRLVNRFDQIYDVGIDCAGYWISKQWLKDWRLVKPKMHVPSQDDPAPDAPEFNHHVRCEHGGLSLNTTSRRRISVEACELLTTLYPSWVPMSSDEEPCSVCDALIHISKEDKREIRKRAEDEKAKLKHMHDNTLNGNMALLENVPCAIVPAHFIRSWRQWLLRPTETPRPDAVDNTPFICEHDLLVFDPNCPADLNTSLAVIKRSDWNVLETLYSGGPLIALEKRIQSGEVHAKFVHDIPVCVDCRQKRKSDWDTTDITIRLSGANEPLTKPDSSKDAIQHAPVTYGTRKAGARQSKRLRQVKDHGERRKLTISKFTTVKEIKVMLQDELSIPTICQRLFYRGQELDDNGATVASLGIFAYDVLDLREEHEINEIDSDSEQAPAKKKRREEERGFGGTLLGGAAERSSSSREETPPDASPDPVEKSCSACTFSNPFNAPNCSMCNTPFR